MLDGTSKVQQKKYNVKMIPRPEWQLILIGWFYSELKYEHLSSPEDFMFRAFNMLLEPRAGHRCFVKAEEVSELFIGLHYNLNCRMAVSGTTIPA